MDLTIAEARMGYVYNQWLATRMSELEREALVVQKRLREVSQAEITQSKIKYQEHMNNLAKLDDHFVAKTPWEDIEKEFVEGYKYQDVSAEREILFPNVDYADHSPVNIQIDNVRSFVDNFDILSFLEIND